MLQPSIFQRERIGHCHLLYLC
ncbi:hypothetical protein NQ318_009088 [Aromia moschata]|uniref:Uncharacterized protein n=1 Tax=Aromia moschata TaxID=1265417 RepID=A0AAV8YW29_9CUCU|nr:hypothetical protein NQ318_009088 [Aromia moschata]